MASPLNMEDIDLMIAQMEYLLADLKKKAQALRESGEIGEKTVNKKKVRDQEIINTVLANRRNSIMRMAAKQKLK